MTAKRIKKGEDGERRCLATGEISPSTHMIRFVVSPDGEVVADLAENLPGRGLWVTASRECLEKVTSGNAFAKAAREPVKVAPDLINRLEDLLKQRIAERLGLARRAGQLVQGFDNVLKSLDTARPSSLLIEAADGAADGRRKVLQAAHARGRTVVVVDCLKASELSLALGRENVIHAAVRPGALADRLMVDVARLQGLRASEVEGMAGDNPAGNERNA